MVVVDLALLEEHVFQFVTGQGVLAVLAGDLVSDVRLLRNLREFELAIAWLRFVELRELPL